MKSESEFISLAIQTTEGEFTARYSKTGLASLDFPRASKRSQISNPIEPDAQIARWHQLTAAALNNVLAGRDAGELPPLDWSHATDFQRAVWGAMLKIRSGQTRSYGEIARDIGSPDAVRAVGAACGENPIPVLVPCHRVVAAGGKLGGFSGGLDWKRKLLERENAVAGLFGWKTD